MAGRIKPRIVKGTRDFLPDQMMRRNYVIDVIRRVFEKYGFEPLETPAMEMWETLSGKYGEEGDRLTYRFLDRGDREVGLRYDLTVPLSRVCAMYPQLPKPFRRYQIQPVWRADKPQKGRFREFFQCDADIVGSSSVVADAEIITVINEVLSVLGFRRFTIRLNSRKILAGLVEASGAGMENEMPVYRSIDKLDKIGLEGVENEMGKRAVPHSAIGKIVSVLEAEGTSRDRLAAAGKVVAASETGSAGIEEINALLRSLEAYDIPAGNFLFDICLARGLDYYTGPIYETIVEEPRIGSITGGGRYDKLIGLFSGNGFPATGSSIGLERIITVMEELDMFPDTLKTSTAVLVTVFNEEMLPYSIRLATILRESGINCDLYAGSSKLRGQFGLANDKGIPLVVIAGPDEQKANQVTLKDMRAGVQESIPANELIERVRERLDAS